VQIRQGDSNVEKETKEAQDKANDAAAADKSGAGNLVTHDLVANKSQVVDDNQSPSTNGRTKENGHR